MKVGSYIDVYKQSLQTTSVNGAANNSEKTSDAAAISSDAVKTENKDRADFSSTTQVINKMTEKERADLVESLKSDLENQSTRFMNMMTQMFQKQGITSLSAGSDAFWQRIASGNFVVDAATQEEAKAAIAEDGYWGVAQTSQRIFDFACALAGDKVAKMEEMQAAIEEGFNQAQIAWGGPMPSITGETYDAVQKLFDDYYNSVA